MAQNLQMSNYLWYIKSSDKGTMSTFFVFIKEESIFLPVAVYEAISEKQ